MNYQLLLEFAGRMLLAMIIGGLIGWERESTYRPAGLRTHILVAIGACIIMQIGFYISLYIVPTLNVDPTRLGAQVISGIGFLGAGTIMKEGATIKGLTTAASIWVVACLGLAIGCGAYSIAIIGCVAVILSRLIFSHDSTFVPSGKDTRFSITIRCENIDETLFYLNEIAEKHHAIISELQFNMLSDQFNELSFNLTTNKLRRGLDVIALLKDLTDAPNIKTVKMNEY